MASMKFTHSVILIFLAALGAFYLGMKYDKQENENPQLNADVLLALDSEFSDFSKANGYYAAFAKYLAEDGVALNAGRQPLIGRENIIATMVNAPEDAQLIWTPEAGDISASGDLGYTWGRYIYSATDEEGNLVESHGKYMTVWKIQETGEWKAVLDGGNPNPPPGD